MHGLRQRGVPSNGVRFWLFLHPPSLAVIPAPLVRCFHSAAACSTWRAPSEAPFQASCSTSNPCLQLKPADWMPCSMQPSGGVGGLGVGLQPTSRHVLVSVFQWKHNSSDLLAVLQERVRHGEVPPVRGSCHTGFPTFGGWTLRPRNRDQARPAGEVSGTFIVLVLTFLFRLISALLFLWSFVGALCQQELYRGPETGWGTLHTCWECWGARTLEERAQANTHGRSKKGGHVSNKGKALQSRGFQIAELNLVGGSLCVHSSFGWTLGARGCGCWTTEGKPTDDIRTW